MLQEDEHVRSTRRREDQRGARQEAVRVARTIPLEYLILENHGERGPEQPHPGHFHSVRPALTQGPPGNQQRTDLDHREGQRRQARERASGEESQG